MDVELDDKALQDQQVYLAWLRRLPILKLKRHHNKVFCKGHKFYMRLPTWCPRYYYERRCFYFYTAAHYHLPDPFRKEFRQRARAILQYAPSDESRAKDMSIVRQLQDFRKFTPRGISKLPEARVDLYLTRLGYLVDLPLDQKRQVLVELYHTHRGDIVPRFSLTTGKPIRYNVAIPTLRQRILQSPHLGYPEFMGKYPEISVKRKTFYRTRWLLKKAGYEIPTLPKGRRKNAMVYKGKATHAGKEIQGHARNRRHKGKETVHIPKGRKNNKGETK